MAKKTTSSEPTFKVGDRVTWASQAAGSWKTKTGIIAQAPPIGTYFDGVRRLATNRHHHMVRVVRQTTRGPRVKYYYPSTSALKLATGKS